jgi:hypothetical protein
MIKIVKIEEVIAEANAKMITAYRIAKDTGLSTQTVYAYFAGEQVSVRTQETIINYINKQSASKQCQEVKEACKKNERIVGKELGTKYKATNNMISTKDGLD